MITADANDIVAAGASVTLNPNGGVDDPLDEALVIFKNVSGDREAAYC